jgi:CHASE3 domain sensor protein
MTTMVRDEAPAGSAVAPSSQAPGWKNPSLGAKIAAGFGISLVLVAMIGITSYRSIRQLIADTASDVHSRQTLRAIDDLMGAFKDAETGQRGYVITGKGSYLQPYSGALTQIAEDETTLRDLIADDPDQQRRLGAVCAAGQAKLAELQRVVDLRRNGGFAPAQAVVNTDVGKRFMDQIRENIAEMARREEAQLQLRVEARRESAQSSLRSVLAGSSIALVLLVVSSLFIRHDIKARVRAEGLAAKLNQQLDAHALELEATNKELEAFCYSVSHDLRAPLRSISGFSDALREDCAQAIGPEGNDHLSRICGAADRMGKLIDDLLNLSRVTRADMRKMPVNLGSIAQEVVADLREADPQRQVEFVPASDLVAEADARLIRVVMENLLRNAWKFTAKKPSARIEFGQMAGAGGRTFFVRDNGAGFDMKFSDKLFGAFQRLHGTAEFPGTGVGLATVQRIIHRHGGRVWATAQPDDGATFFFTL